MLQAIVADLAAGTPPAVIAGRFHQCLANMVLEVCLELRRQYNLSTVALSGGVWQNLMLLRQTVQLLQVAGFTTLIHRQVPANDGGLALGQAIIAAQKLVQ
jgi:hydrogenase maturation protein HypF